MEARTFLYHRVKVPTEEELHLEKITGCPLCIDPKIFENQIKTINDNFKVISIDDFLKNKIPRNSVMITFDDGYKDFYTNAFPILKKYKIPATIFLITDFVDTKKPFWWDELLSVIYNTKTESFDEFKLTSCKDRTTFLGHVLSKFHEITQDEKEHYIGVLKDVLGYEEIEGKNLSWDNIKEMMGDGISIGSHTISHPVLTKVPLKRMRREISNSKIEIEKKLNKEVKAFAYPYGGSAVYNEKIKSIIRYSGYHCAFTTHEKTNSANSDLFELGRFTIPRKTVGIEIFWST